MHSKPSKAVPVDEVSVTAPAGRIDVIVETEEAFFARVRKQVAERRAGRRREPCSSISYAASEQDEGL
jgi:hypothetical protein